MKILMVYPEFPETFWKFNHALSFIGKKASLPPLSLLTVASLLPDNWNIRLIDMNVHPLRNKDLLWADYIFISALTIQRSGVKAVIKKCLLHGKKIVAGGPLFTTMYYQFPEVHHLVLNEAEVTLPEFLKDIESGCPKPIYQSSVCSDISSSPVPRWDLIDVKNYSMLCIQQSRGCPFSCDFCDISVLYGSKYRVKPTENIIRELETIYQKGWRGGVSFVDDNFIGNKKHLKHDLLPKIIKWMKDKDYPFRFHTQASINIADDDVLLDMLVKAGLDAVFLGIETPDIDGLQECGKKQNIGKDILGSVRKLHNSGILVQGGFIIGFDSDKGSVFKKMSDFINNSGIVTSMVGLLNAPLGTKLYKRLLRENRIVKDDTGDNTDFSINFLPKMEYRQLFDGYNSVIRDIYNPEAYYKRLKLFLKHYNNLNKFKRKLSLEHIRAIFLAFFRLGMNRALSKHFWKLMIWTTLRKPRLIPLALNLSIYSYHFVKYYEITP